MAPPLLRSLLGRGALTPSPWTSANEGLIEPRETGPEALTQGTCGVMPRWSWRSRKKSNMTPEDDLDQGAIDHGILEPLVGGKPLEPLVPQTETGAIPVEDLHAGVAF